MKKVVALLLLVCILNACGASEAAEQAFDSDIAYAEAVDCTTTGEISVAEAIVYVLNTNTKKIHEPTCYVVAMIKEENRSALEGDFEDLYAKGYTLCGHCLGDA